MRTNRDVAPVYTHEGGPAGRKSAVHALESLVATCMLWENTFYEKGSQIAENIAELAAQVPMADLARIAHQARFEHKLRHAPLWLAVQAAKRGGPGVADLIADVVHRADEAPELIALWLAHKENKPGVKAKLTHQMQKGLARAFLKWNEYQLAKWDKDARQVKMRDALFLCHAKPDTKERAELWRRLVEGKLATPDTWEVALSSGADKKATWERLLNQRALGYDALLKNLRNMTEAGVDRDMIHGALRAGAEKAMVLPFRFVAALRHAPQFARELDEAMRLTLKNFERLPGYTQVLIDVSGSMDAPISAKSEINRWEAAAALAALIMEVCNHARVFTFSSYLVEVSNFPGLPLIDAVNRSQPHASTRLRHSLEQMAQGAPGADRVIVITDEQSEDGIANAYTKHAYIINVAAYRNGLDVSQGWTRISGWSERVVDWIRWYEKEEK